MSTEEIIRYLMSLFGGGLIVAVLGWVREARSTTRLREIARIQDQLNHLYSPLDCWTRQNVRCAQQAERVSKAYTAKFEGRHYSDEAIQAVTPLADATIELQNAYSDEVKETNVRIAHAIEENWSLVDDADVEVFQEFLHHRRRMRVEVDGKKADGVPLDVKLNVGLIQHLDARIRKAGRGPVERKTPATEALTSPKKVVASKGGASSLIRTRRPDQYRRRMVPSPGHLLWRRSGRRPCWPVRRPDRAPGGVGPGQLNAEANFDPRSRESAGPWKWFDNTGERGSAMRAFFLSGRAQALWAPRSGAISFGTTLATVNGQWEVDYPTLPLVIRHLYQVAATASVRADWGLEEVWSCLDYYAKLQGAIGRAAPWAGLQRDSTDMKRGLSARLRQTP